MNSSQQFTKLLEPGKIGTMTVRNRIVMPPMSSTRGSDEGYVTQQCIDHYEARALGGFGMVITEFTSVDSTTSRAGYFQLFSDNDRFIPGLRKISTAIKRHDARAVLQIHHGGRTARSAITGRQPVAPSAIARPGAEMPRELTEAEIVQLVNSFAQAAVRATKAGFDGVELHGAHGYMIMQFLSGASNKRQDRYGGSVENRARFLTEILQAIRREVGRDFPVWFRLTPIEPGIQDGLTIEQSMQITQLAEKAGADAVHLSTLFEGGIVPLAAAVKSVVKIPVLAASCMDFALAEATLREKKADFIVFGRRSLADPELGNKLASGRADEVVPCLYCGKHYLPLPGGMRCSVNPTLGREREFRITRAKKSKKVIVIGGGPAGMEAARVAALRGHKVQLYEKGPELGGQLLLAQIPPHKEKVSEFLHYLKKQMDKRGVEVHLNTEVTADLIAKESPDAVILANGASPFSPDIPGIKGNNVVQANDVLTGKSKTGKNVFIIGGELVGCEVADFLTDAGKKATPSSLLPELVSQLLARERTQLLNRLAAKGVDLSLTGVKAYKEITPNRVVIIDKDGKERTIEADTVVVAVGSKPNKSPLPTLGTKVAEVYSVGDCIKARSIMEAMNEAYRAGLSV